MKRNKKKLKQLNQKIAAAKATLKETTKDQDKDANKEKEKPDNASDAFGGKNFKK